MYSWSLSLSQSRARTRSAPWLGGPNAAIEAAVDRIRPRGRDDVGSGLSQCTQVRLRGQAAGRCL